MVLAATLFAIVAGQPGHGLTTGPEPTRYRIEQRLESRIDLSAFGAGEQVQTQSFVWFATMSYSDSAGGRVVHAILDSVQADFGAVPVPQSSIDSARGSTFHGYLNAWGKMTSLTALKTSTMGATFESVLRNFHPRRKPGAKQGDGWTDTLDFEVKSPQGNVNIVTVSNYVLGGQEGWEGGRATRLDAAFSTAQSGTVETPAGPADMQGKGTGTGVHYLGADGRYLGGTATSKGESTISGSFAPSAIPVKQTYDIKVTVIK